MFQTASDQSNSGNSASAANKDAKERELSNQLKDAKQNKITKQIIPFETEGTFTGRFFSPSTFFRNTNISVTLPLYFVRQP